MPEPKRVPRKPFDPTTKLRMASVTPDETACAIFMARHARPSNRKPARRDSHAAQSHANRCLRALAIGVGRQRRLVGRIPGRPRSGSLAENLINQAAGPWASPQKAGSPLQFLTPKGEGTRTRRGRQRLLSKRRDSPCVRHRELLNYCRE
jgi:hypothetical protein